jgi:anaerobic magnesium-protoporphyrin IX monomethyl ester cyclase
MNIALVVMRGVYTPLNTNRVPTSALAYLSAVAIEEDCQVRVLDAHLDNLDPEEVAAWLRSGPKIDILGFSIPSQIVWFPTKDLIESLSDILHHTWVVAGGLDVSLRTMDILRECPRIDAAVLGEGEETFRDIIRDRKHSGHEKKPTLKPGMAIIDSEYAIHKGPLRPAIDDLDQLPFPSYDFAKKSIDDGYIEYYSVVSSRGCPGSCVFCCINPHWSENPGIKWRVHSVGYMLRLIEHGRALGIDRFGFVDDCFMGGTQGLKRADDFSQEVIKRKWDITFSIMVRAVDVCASQGETTLRHLTEAGLTSVFLGIDGCTEHDLEWLGKGSTPGDGLSAIKILSQLDVATGIGLIIIHPGSSCESINKSLDYIQELQKIHPKLKIPWFSGVLVYDGTPLAQRAKQNGFYGGNGRLGIIDQLPEAVSKWEDTHYWIYRQLQSDFINHSPENQKVMRSELVTDWMISTLRDRIQLDNQTDIPSMSSELLKLFALIASKCGIGYAVEVISRFGKFDGREQFPPCDVA